MVGKCVTWMGPSARNRKRRADRKWSWAPINLQTMSEIVLKIHSAEGDLWPKLKSAGDIELGYICRLVGWLVGSLGFTTISKAN